MDTHTNRNHILDAIDDVLSSNSTLIAGTTDATFVPEWAADAILAGQVTPNDNDGLATDELHALALGAVMADGPWWVRGTLVDYWTGEELRVATREQVLAAVRSKNDMTGTILIDADGDVVTEGTWEAQQPGVRTVWVAR